MKKLLYIALANLQNPRDGVSQKIKMQIEALRKNGYIVDCIAYGNGGIFLYKHNKEEKLQRYLKLTPYRISFFYSITRYLKNNYFDVCYIRFSYCDFQFLRILNILNKRYTKTYVEFPSYPYKYLKLPFKLMYLKILFMMDRLTVKKMGKYVHKFLTVGEPVESIFGVPAINIPNGVSIEDYKLKKINNCSQELNILCIANMYIYQGYDRLIEGLKTYYSTSKTKLIVRVHIVGIGPEEMNYKQMTKAANLNDYVRFYGELSGDELDEVFDKCNLACSGLAYHRRNIVYASPLKTREYFARGIPFIYAYEEIGLPNDYPFALRIASGDEAVNINEIISFYNSLKDNLSEISEKMRMFAKNNYAWESILKVVE